MGIYTDLFANARTIDATAPREGNQRAVYAKLDAARDRQGDLDYPTSTAAIDEVQSIAQHVATVDGGTYTLTVSLKGKAAFTTAAIAYNANVATIEGAIDTAAALASVPDFEAGDISVGGAALSAGAATFTYDGASVAEQNHGEITIDDAELTGGGTAGAVSTTTEGQSNRTALAVLICNSTITDSLPAQGVTATITAGENRLGPNALDHDTIRALALEAGVQDDNKGLETAILTALGL